MHDQKAGDQRAAGQTHYKPNLAGWMHLQNKARDHAIIHGSLGQNPNLAEIIRHGPRVSAFSSRPRNCTQANPRPGTMGLFGMFART
jgi:hypothetical protein